MGVRLQECDLGHNRTPLLWHFTIEKITLYYYFSYCYTLTYYCGQISEMQIMYSNGYVIVLPLQEYLQSLHEHYENWLGNDKHHVWHGNTPVMVHFVMMELILLLKQFLYRLCR